MIHKIQQFLDEHTNGVIHTRKEAVYVVTIGILVIILILSVVGRIFV